MAFHHVPSYQNAYRYLGQPQQKLGVRWQISCKVSLMPFPQIIAWAKICIPTQLFPCVHVCTGQSSPTPLEMHYIAKCIAH